MKLSTRKDKPKVAREIPATSKKVIIASSKKSLRA
jgi:hypothetical protein